MYQILNFNKLKWLVLCPLVFLLTACAYDNGSGIPTQTLPSPPPLSADIKKTDLGPASFVVDGVLSALRAVASGIGQVAVGIMKWFVQLSSSVNFTSGGQSCKVSANPIEPLVGCSLAMYGAIKWIPVAFITLFLAFYFIKYSLQGVFGRLVKVGIVEYSVRMILLLFVSSSLDWLLSFLTDISNQMFLLLLSSDFNTTGTGTSSGTISLPNLADGLTKLNDLFLIKQYDQDNIGFCLLLVTLCILLAIPMIGIGMFFFLRLLLFVFYLLMGPWICLAAMLEEVGGSVFMNYIMRLGKLAASILPPALILRLGLEYGKGLSTLNGGATPGALEFIFTLLVLFFIFFVGFILSFWMAGSGIKGAFSVGFSIAKVPFVMAGNRVSGAGQKVSSAAFKISGGRIGSKAPPPKRIGMTEDLLGQMGQRFSSLPLVGKGGNSSQSGALPPPANSLTEQSSSGRGGGNSSSGMLGSLALASAANSVMSSGDQRRFRTESAQLDAARATRGEMLAIRGLLETQQRQAEANNKSILLVMERLAAFSSPSSSSGQFPTSYAPVQSPASSPSPILMASAPPGYSSEVVYNVSSPSPAPILVNILPDGGVGPSTAGGSAVYQQHYNYTVNGLTPSAITSAPASASAVYSGAVPVSQVSGPSPSSSGIASHGQGQEHSYDTGFVNYMPPSAPAPEYFSVSGNNQSGSGMSAAPVSNVSVQGSVSQPVAREVFVSSPSPVSYYDPGSRSRQSKPSSPSPAPAPSYAPVVASVSQQVSSQPMVQSQQVDTSSLQAQLAQVSQGVQGLQTQIDRSNQSVQGLQSNVSQASQGLQGLQSQAQQSAQASPSPVSSSPSTPPTVVRLDEGRSISTRPYLSSSARRLIAPGARSSND